MYKTKGFQHCGVQEKTESERVLTPAQVQSILDQVKIQAKSNLFWRRDYAAIYLGFYLGLRVSEAGILSRRTFADIDSGEIRVMTLKKRVTWDARCPQCRRGFRARRLGVTVCRHCQHTWFVDRPPDVKGGPHEVLLPAVEQKVLDFVRQYIAEMPPKQFYLFPSTLRDENGFELPLSSGHLSKIFGHWAMAAGLSPKYSWHSLRHARGTYLYDKFNDPKIVQEFMRHSSISSTQIYLHLSPQRKAELRRVLDDDAGVA